MSHTYTSLQYHLVFSTKERRPLLSKELMGRVHAYIGGIVRNYIQNQEEHHRKTSFQEEFLSLLQRHGISYEERYLWV